MKQTPYVAICIVVFVSAGAWGLYWLPQRLLLESGMTGGWGTLGQYLISLCVLLPVAIWRVHKGQQIGLRHWLCGLLLGTGAIFYANSFLVTEVIRALVFFYLADEFLLYDFLYMFSNSYVVFQMDYLSYTPMFSTSGFLNFLSGLRTIPTGIIPKL